jgi:hypothetical protein
MMWISIALSGVSAAAPVASSIVSLISPRGGTATIGGWVNLVNNLMGVAAPVITAALLWNDAFPFPALSWLQALCFWSASSLMLWFLTYRNHSGPDPVN